MLSAISLSLAVATAGLSLQISSPRTTVLTGEPVKLVTTWKLSRDANVYLEGADARDLPYLTVWVDGGVGFKRYREYPRVISEEIVVPAPLRTGEERITNVLLFRGGYVEGGVDRPGFLFPAPGQYSLKLSYVDPKEGLSTESNVLTFTAQAPSGDEVAVLQAIQSEPKILDARRLAETEDLVSRYPSSRYLKRAKLALLAEQASELHNRYDPLTGESLWHLDGVQLTAVRRQHLARMAQEIQADAAWGAFEEESLALAMNFTYRSGDMATAASLKNDILARFPRSAAAQGIRELDVELAEAAREDQETDDTPPPSNDTTPPTLFLSPSPLSLWPPNHKLVPVAVTVNVSDNVDPNPVVKLVSITCDDGCDPNLDVVGATLNTDDRQFQLRAERSGGGSGRTYTITYSAKDVAGNTATKTTTVRVPHSQGN